MEEEEEIVQLIIFSSKVEMMYKQGEGAAELYATALDKMRNMNFTRPVKLPSNRRYFLVMKMSGMTCLAGEGWSYLHCLQTEKGGVQVVFVTPEKGDLGGMKGLPYNQILCLIITEEFLQYSRSWRG